MNSTQLASWVELGAVIPLKTQSDTKSSVFCQSWTSRLTENCQFFVDLSFRLITAPNMLWSFNWPTESGQALFSRFNTSINLIMRNSQLILDATKINLPSGHFFRVGHVTSAKQKQNVHQLKSKQPHTKLHSRWTDPVTITAFNSPKINE